MQRPGLAIGRLYLQPPIAKYPKRNTFSTVQDFPLGEAIQSQPLENLCQCHLSFSVIEHWWKVAGV